MPLSKMCLVKIHTLPKIAMKPITVYKELLISDSGDIITAYMLNAVRLNHTIEASRPWHYNIISPYVEGQGIHAYDSIQAAVFRRIYVPKVEVPNFGSFTTIIVKAIIPRFSFYWKGEDYEIASSKMFITNELVASSQPLIPMIKKTI